jgi:hypothetical protein
LAFETVFIHGLPADDFREDNNLDAADEDGGIHNLGSSLVGREEQDRAKNSEGQEDEGVCPDPDYNREIFSAIEVLCHRAEGILVRFIVHFSAPYEIVSNRLVSAFSIANKHISYAGERQ